MRLLAQMARVVLFLVILIAIVNVVAAIVSGYLVFSGNAKPGMFVEDLAPTYGTAAIHGIVSVAVIGLAFWGRGLLQRWLNIAAGDRSGKKATDGHASAD